MGRKKSKSSGSILGRNSACLSCRRRKLKCSGTRPTCDMCNHYNRVHECQYDDSSKKSYTQILREKTSELEAKLRKLEGESSCTPQGTLFSDFPNYLEPDTTLSDDIHNALVQTFFRHHKQCCFYSNSSRFDFSSSAILFQHNPPSSSLMSAIHLLGSFFSHTPHLNELQFILLDQASRNLSRSLHDNWQELSMESKMDDVQASCLLAQYCYFNHRMLEGNQKLLTAKRLASVLGLYSVSGPDISAPQETTEKLAVFWQVFTVDKFWSATNQDLMLPDVAPFLNPTTPLPVKEGVALGVIVASSISITQVFNFEFHVDNSTISALGFKAIASAIFDRSLRLYNSWPEVEGALELLVPARIGLKNLSSWVDPFPGRVSSPSKPFFDTDLYTIHILILTSIIQLYFYNISPEFFNAANKLYELINFLQPEDYCHLDPILAICWSSLVVSFRRIAAPSNRENSMAPYPNPFCHIIDSLMEALRSMSRHYPVVR